jgi:3-hydroxybutyryl-CoA dehydrogenase
MNILVIGDEENAAACKERFGTGHHLAHVPDHQSAGRHLITSAVIFDFLIEEDPHTIDIYENFSGTLFLNTVKVSLGELSSWINPESTFTLVGFNGLPSMFSRPVLEIAFLDKDDETTVKPVLANLGADYLVVDDRVGMVTPRVICMIINEAYYTVQEGTATREDIDMAMKLGTNYPYGPFEWCRLIGIHHVYEVLEAVYEDTKDERYKICPLLKKEYIRRPLS